MVRCKIMLIRANLGSRSEPVQDTGVGLGVGCVGLHMGLGFGHSCMEFMLCEFNL